MTVHWPALHAELVRALGRPGVSDEVRDDLVQDAAERLLRGLPTLRDEDRLGAYVGRVVRSVWVDHLRRRRPSPGEVAPDDLPAAEPEPEDLGPMVASWLPLHLAALPEAYREAVRLSELEGLTQREVAARLGLSPSGARSRVQRGRRLLREELEACCRIVREGPQVVEVVPRASCCDDASAGGSCSGG